jgi:hypothetical protein
VTQFLPSHKPKGRFVMSALSIMLQALLAEAGKGT